MTKTENYNLNQWDAADPIRREDFNADNAALDAALDAIKSAAEEDNAALNESINSDLAALTARVGVEGHTARLLCGTYTGTGSYGPNNPNTLAFRCKPMLVYVEPSSSNQTPVMLLRPFVKSTGGRVQLPLTWAEKSVSWYYSTLSATDAVDQLNESGRVYQWFALCIEESESAE